MGKWGNVTEAAESRLPLSSHPSRTWARGPGSRPPSCCGTRARPAGSPLLHSFTPSFIHSFIHSLLHSFTPSFSRGAHPEPRAGRQCRRASVRPQARCCICDWGPRTPPGKAALGLRLHRILLFPRRDYNHTAPSWPFHSLGEGLDPSLLSWVCRGALGHPSPTLQAWAGGWQPTASEEEVPDCRSRCPRVGKVERVSEWGTRAQRRAVCHPHTQTHPNSWASLRGRWDCASVHWAGKSAMW